MEQQERIWIAVLGSSGGRLLCGRRVASGPTGKSWRLRLEAVEAIGNPLWELDKAGNGDPHRVGSRRSELFARYAVDLVKWLDGHAKKRGIERLEIFAAPRLLSLLNSMYPASLADRVHENRCDLKRLSVHELEEQEEILELFRDGSGQSSRRAS